MQDGGQVDETHWCGTEKRKVDGRCWCATIHPGKLPSARGSSHCVAISCRTQVLSIHTAPQAPSFSQTAQSTHEAMSIMGEKGRKFLAHGSLQRRNVNLPRGGWAQGLSLATQMLSFQPRSNGTNNRIRRGCSALMGSHLPWGRSRVVSVWWKHGLAQVSEDYKNPPPSPCTGLLWRRGLDLPARQCSSTHITSNHRTVGRMGWQFWLLYPTLATALPRFVSNWKCVGRVEESCGTRGPSKIDGRAQAPCGREDRVVQHTNMAAVFWTSLQISPRSLPTNHFEPWLPYW